MAGFRTITIPSAPDGGVDIDAFKAALGPQTAAIMITNPSTLGLFERRIGELLDATHEAGALAYMDGANLNAILGRFKPGEAGFDVMHFNTHKTFSTPHGGGGPGAGPVGVRATPRPVPARAAGRQGGRRRLPAGEPGRAADLDRPDAQLRRQQRGPRARVRVYPGARRVGPARGERRRGARRELPQAPGGRGYEIPFDRPCKHEFVASAASSRRATGVRTLDVAKRLIDKGFHPPTIYFPLTVEEGMLIEPTETESLETLDAFADALLEIAREARESRSWSPAPPRRAGPPPRRGDRGAPAEPPLAGHDRRPDALPRLRRRPADRTR